MYDDDAVNLGGSIPSSFQGRLNMDIFRFNAGSSPQTAMQKDANTQPRRSNRISATINTAFKPTKANTKSSPKKRKASNSTNTLLTTRSSEEESAADQTDAPPGSLPTDRVLSSPNSSRKKRNRPRTGYAPPTTYAHLPQLPDALAPNMHILFCGLNPGIRTAQTGHAYNHPSNRFWKLMYSSGVLPVPCTAEEDRTLPARFNLGLTNIVSRPSRNGGELSKAEMDAGVAVLEEKVRRWRPEVFCVVGKGIWEAVWRVRHGGKAVGQAFRYGWQDESENIGVGGVEETDKIDGVVYREGWKGAKVFVASSTSGLAATLRPEEKERIWRELGVWMEQRRAEEAAHKVSENVD